VIRDIKLENILIDEDMNIKLIDFGFSTVLTGDKKLKLFCGTPNFMAPEIVTKKDYDGTSADIWACGVVLFVLLTGSFPFKGANDKELY
jgi:serine/threonine protein kinase